MGRTFRHEAYGAYKTTACRPDDLGVQFRRIRQMVSALHIPVVEKEGYEADDLLGTLAREAEEQGLTRSSSPAIPTPSNADHRGVASSTPAERRRLRLYDRDAVIERYEG